MHFPVTLWTYLFPLSVWRIMRANSTSADTEVRMQTAEVKWTFLLDSNLVFQSWIHNEDKTAHTCFWAGEMQHTWPFKPILLPTLWVSTLFWAFLDALLEIGRGCVRWAQIRCFCFFFLNQNSLLFKEGDTQGLKGWEALMQGLWLPLLAPCVLLYMHLCKLHVTALEIYMMTTLPPHCDPALDDSKYYCQRSILSFFTLNSLSTLKPTWENAPNCFLFSCHQGRKVRKRLTWSSIPSVYNNTCSSQIPKSMALGECSQRAFPQLYEGKYSNKRELISRLKFYTCHFEYWWVGNK